MQKGIVLESDKKWTVVLTPDGQFCKVPTQPHYIEGMEITFQPTTVGQVNSTSRFRSPKLLKSISAVAACVLLLVCIFPFITSKPAYAAVTIDINPSLQLDVDKQGDVLDVHPLNTDAKNLISHLEWKNRKISDVTLEVIQLAENEGLMNSQHQVIISTTFYKPEDGQQKQLDTMLKDTAAKTNPDLTVVVVDTNKQWLEEAKKQDVTLGSYSVVKQAEQQGIHVQVADIQKGNIEDLPEVQGVQIIHPKKKKQVQPAFHSNQESGVEPEDMKVDGEKNANDLTQKPENKDKIKENKQEKMDPETVLPNEQHDMKMDHSKQEDASNSHEDQEYGSRGQDQKNKASNMEKDRSGEQPKEKKNNNNRVQKSEHGEGKDHKSRD